MMTRKQKYTIAYFAIMASIIIFGILSIKFFLWWDGIWVVLGILAGIGFFVSQELWDEIKKERKMEKK